MAAQSSPKENVQNLLLSLLNTCQIAIWQNPDNHHAKKLKMNLLGSILAMGRQGLQNIENQHSGVDFGQGSSQARET